jgi:hypothetical protein
MGLVRASLWGCPATIISPSSDKEDQTTLRCSRARALLDSIDRSIVRLSNN